MLEIYYSYDQETKKTTQNIVFEFCKQNMEEVIQDAKTRKNVIPIEKIKDYMR
jgi:serine/threonine protein kinase